MPVLKRPSFGRVFIGGEEQKHPIKKGLQSQALKISGVPKGI
jgi:hypothetical protein